MSSRGSRIRNGHVTTNEYHQVGEKIYNAKILEGNDNQHHGLPDYSHSPNSVYIKLNEDGTFRELRVYDENGFPLYEIAYHAEINLTGNRHEKILHMHKIFPDLHRELIGKVEKNSKIYKINKKYLKEFGL